MASTSDNQINGNIHDAATDSDGKIPLKKGGVKIKVDTQPSSAPAENGKTAESPPEATKTNEEKYDSPELVSKQIIRNQTRNNIKTKKCYESQYSNSNKLTNFIGTSTAAQLFTETPEYKKAYNIKVQNERLLDAIKIHIISTGKKLYMSKQSRSESIFSEILCGSDEFIEFKQMAIMPRYFDKHSVEHTFTDKIKMDMYIIGSVAVSKTGQRIGKGNGYVDLDFAILKHCGFITDETLIVTIVHDVQVHDTFPNDLFTNNDIPVDMIVTPTEVIYVKERLPRPAGINWNLLSERRMNVVPVLKLIKQQEEQNGQVIVLKDEDSDFEANRSQRRPFNRRLRKRNDTDGSNNNSKTQRPYKRYYRRFNKNPKTKDNNVQVPSNEEKKSEVKTNSHESESEGNNKVTKKSIRMKIWKEIQDNICAVSMLSHYDRIPYFLGAQRASIMLSQLDEYKNAKTIKVSSDKAQDAVKIQAITDSKELYVAAARDSTALYTKIYCAHDAEVEIKQMAIKSQHLPKYGDDIKFEDKVELDMLVIGSVAVSKSGQVIGRGQGLVDLDFGVLVKAGAITDKTLIVTTVHQQQVCDTLPDELFAEYDVPVDIIVTPDEVIRVENRRKRPQGIYWNLLSERRVQTIPVLKALKEKDESEGLPVNLKENVIVDKPKPRHPQRFRKNTRQFSESNHKNITDGETEVTTNTTRRFYRPYYRQPKQSITDGTDGEQPVNKNRFKTNNKKKRHNIDYVIKVSRIPINTRPKTMRTELREHGCKPVYMLWRGYRQTCFLYFGKKRASAGAENHDTDTDYEEHAVNLVSAALENLVVADDTNDTTTNSSQNVASKLRIEFVKRQQSNQNSSPVKNVVNGTAGSSTHKLTENRIETVDVSAV